MNKITLLLTVIFTLSIVAISCDKLKELTTFTQNFDYKETFEVPGLPNQQQQLPQGGLSESLPRFGVATNSEEYINQSQTKTDLVTKVALTKAALTITNPTDQHFDYVDTIKMFISGAGGSNEQLVAYKYDIPKGKETIDLDETDINLKEYFLLDSMFYRIYAHFVGIPDSNTTIELNATLSMDASLLN